MTRADRLILFVLAIIIGALVWAQYFDAVRRINQKQNEINNLQAQLHICANDCDLGRIR